MLKIKRKSLLLLVLPALVFSMFSPLVYADDTSNYPWIRPDNWLAQIITSPSGGVSQGHIVVDIQLEKPGQAYNPCHNISDTYSAACGSSGGYYKVVRYNSTSNDFPYGIFIDNSNNGSNHFWARRVSTAFLEIYPYSVSVPAPLDGYRLDPGACGCVVYGGFEVVINDWKGGYSADIGNLRAVSPSDSDAGKLNGFIKRNGSTVKQGDVNIDWFGQDSSKNRSSSDYPVYSFASWPANSDGYYTSGPVIKGNYHIYVLDKGGNRKVECVGIPINGSADRLDMELTQQHFGLDSPGRQCYDRQP